MGKEDFVGGQQAPAGRDGLCGVANFAVAGLSPKRKKDSVTTKRQGQRMPDLPQNVFYHLELCLAGHHGVVKVGPIKGQLGRGYLKPKKSVCQLYAS